MSAMRPDVPGLRLASFSNRTSSQPGAPETLRIVRSSESGAIVSIFSSQSAMKRGGFYREVRIPNLCGDLPFGDALGPDLPPPRPGPTTHPVANVRGGGGDSGSE